MSLTAFILRRLALMVLSVIGVTLVTFLISHSLPADPVVTNLGQQASQRPEIVAAFKERWGLDRPLHEQYLRFLGGLVRGDLGTSLNTRRPIVTDLQQFMPATIELTLVAILFATLVGVPLGVLAAVRQNSWIDQVARFLSLVGVSVPIFWLAIIALLVFYANLHLAAGPGRLSSGVKPPPSVTNLYLVDSLLALNFATFKDALWHLALPGLVLGSSVLGLVTRVTRASMLDVLGQEYVRTARAKGMREIRMLVGHALPNAMIPTLTILGLAVGNLLTGAVMTETIFAWPGMGRYAFQATIQLDFPAVVAVTLVFAVIYILANLIVDILYSVVDPRIRTR